MDYCNTVYMGLPLKSLWKFLRNVAVQLINDAGYAAHVTPQLRELTGYHCVSGAIQVVGCYLAHEKYMYPNLLSFLLLLVIYSTFSKNLSCNGPTSRLALYWIFTALLMPLVTPPSFHGRRGQEQLTPGSFKEPNAQRKMGIHFTLGKQR